MVEEPEESRRVFGLSITMDWYPMAVFFRSSVHQKERGSGNPLDRRGRVRQAAGAQSMSFRGAGFESVLRGDM